MQPSQVQQLNKLTKIENSFSIRFLCTCSNFQFSYQTYAVYGKQNQATTNQTNLPTKQATSNHQPTNQPANQLRSYEGHVYFIVLVFLSTLVCCSCFFFSFGQQQHLDYHYIFCDQPPVFESLLVVLIFRAPSFILSPTRFSSRFGQCFVRVGNNTEGFSQVYWRL